MDDLVLSVERDPASGRWRVIADDGSVVETDLPSAGAARRWIEDRADLSDVELRSMVARCTPAQRRELRAMLDEIEAGDAAR